MNAIYRGENEALGIRRGWLEHVSVRRPWRGRGVAKALCAASFRVLRDQGMDEAWLGVDGSNPTGAVRLYEGLGFGVVRQWKAYGRPHRGSGTGRLAACGAALGVAARRPDGRPGCGMARPGQAGWTVRSPGRRARMPAWVDARGSPSWSRPRWPSRRVPGPGHPRCRRSQATGSDEPGIASATAGATVHRDTPVPTPSPGLTGSPAEETPMSVFTLTSSAIAAGGSIPRRFTCDGADTSPELAWNGAPAGTAALVLVVDDPDAGGFVHWLVLDLPGADQGTLAGGIPPSAASLSQGTNDFGRRGWGGPCPPSGEHRYTFTMYALAAPLGLPDGASKSAVRRALAGANVLATAVLGARYRRAG